MTTLWNILQAIKRIKTHYTEKCNNGCMPTMGRTSISAFVVKAVGKQATSLSAEGDFLNLFGVQLGNW